MRRANQAINASATHAVPSTPGQFQPDTSNSAQSGPHLLSRHICKAVNGTNIAPTKTAIQTQRQA